MNRCRLLWVVFGIAVPAFLMAAFGRAATGNPSAQLDDAFPAAVSRVTITPARPDAGDLQRMDALRKNGAKIDAADAPVYIAKIHFLGSLPIDNEGFTVWVGDQLVKEYGSFKSGIFFKIYDPNEWDKMAGKEICIKRRGKTIMTGKNIPDYAVFGFSGAGELQYPSVADVLSTN
jgi:hypothetical protein